MSPSLLDDPRLTSRYFFPRRAPLTAGSQATLGQTYPPEHR
jgi:hypothetical protein